MKTITNVGHAVALQPKRQRTSLSIRQNRHVETTEYILLDSIAGSGLVHLLLRRLRTKDGIVLEVPLPLDDDLSATSFRGLCTMFVNLLL